MHASAAGPAAAAPLGSEAPESATRPRLAILRSSTFRLALVYASLFGVSVMLLLAFIYWSTAGYMTRQTEAAIEAEIDTFAERYRSTGLPGLVRLIEERLEDRTSLYLLADPAYRPLVGNLERWPQARRGQGGWLELQIRRDPGGAQPALARTFTLPGAFHLLVGRDVAALSRTKRLITRTLVWGLGLTVLLALTGGVLMSRSTARRIEAIRRTGSEIMRGDLSRRIPRDGSNDDFDQLAVHLNEMLDRIAAAMDGVREVADNIAHDLRTPLGRLRNRLEILQARSGGARAEVDAALEETDRLLATFNALLRIARIEAGERVSGFAEVDVALLLRDVAELYEPAAQEKGQHLAVDLPPHAPVPGDRHLLFQAFANVLDNAIKYSPRGGAITLRADARPGQVRVRVSDSGPGVPVGERDAVMRRFHRGESSRTTTGSGLGLSLVAAVAKVHRATFELGGDDSGLEVEWRFPSTVEPRRGHRPRPPARGARATGNPCRGGEGGPSR